MRQVSELQNVLLIIVGLFAVIQGVYYRTKTRGLQKKARDGELKKIKDVVNAKSLVKLVDESNESRGIKKP